MDSPVSASSRSIDKGKRVETGSTTRLIDLPQEVLSQIASILPLNEQLGFLSLHSSLLALTRSSYSPIPDTVRSILSTSTAYPATLARLPTLSLYIPDDGGYSFIELLVRARPRWILEELQYGRWRDEIWREAFERRFLRSWRRFKGENDSWRAAFLRLLGRLEHRFVGCSHEDAWTRFVTLHRNGSASINRIYSRTFDPYEIYDEFKHQNNFASQPTQVRVVVHLQDVRILAIGVLHSEPSLFVNPNAHLVLHPPLLRNVDLPPSPSVAGIGSLSLGEGAKQPAVTSSHRPSRAFPGAVSPSANSNEIYYPLVRSLSPSGPSQTTYGLGEGSQPGPGSASPTGLLSTFAKVLPGRTRRASSMGNENDDRGGLFRVISRERDTDDRRRNWSFHRPRHNSAASSLSIPVLSQPTQPTQPEPRSTIATPITPKMPTLPELPVESTFRPPTPPRTPTPGYRRSAIPYARLIKPQPHVAYRDYPNYTLNDHTRVDELGQPLRGDRRMLHEEVEDAGVGAIWSPAEGAWGGDGRKMSEWDERQGCRRRWVGPMLLVAQLHPPDRDSAVPAAASGALEGDSPNLGHPGMYASVGYEDLEDLFPWIELKGAGIGGESRRAGLGFE